MAQAEGGIRDVYAVLLAAGVSRRFGSSNKLLEDIDGTPLVRRVAERLLGSALAGVIVVTGFEANRLAEVLRGLDLQIVHNADHGAGLSTSLRCGIAALPELAAGAMIVLADMPDITSAFTDGLLDDFAQGAGQKIVYPVNAEGAQGNPVIWPARFFAELQSLSGDAGAKQLIARHQGETRPVRTAKADMLHDIDTPGDLKSWRTERENR